MRICLPLTLAGMLLSAELFGQVPVMPPATEDVAPVTLPATDSLDLPVDVMGGALDDNQLEQPLDQILAAEQERNEVDIDALCGRQSMASVLDPLCGFYRQMREVMGGRGAGSRDFAGFISGLHRRGQAVAFEPLTVIDLLLMDSRRMAFYAVDARLLQQLGVDQGVIDTLPAAERLQLQLQDVFDSMPEGVGELPETLALAVWRDGLRGVRNNRYPIAVVVLSSNLPGLQ